MKSIFWFRNDLRLEDNEALIKAISLSESILPVYILENNSLQNVAPGFQRVGEKRFRFLAESLEALHQDLQKLGSQLLVFEGISTVKIPELVNRFGIQAVFASKSFSWDECQEEILLEKTLFKMQCDLRLFSTETLIHPEDLPFPVAALPEVFTKFRKEVEPIQKIRKPYPKPTFIPAPSVSMNSQLKKVWELSGKNRLPFEGGEDAGNQRLQYYTWQTRLISSYKETRNGLLGTDYSSRLSPWLALGCLSPRSIFFEIKDFEKKVCANESTYWLIFELLWRDFFKFLSRKWGNKLFKIGGLKNFQGEWRKDKNIFWLWANGKTGNPFVDANIQEMLETGFMSNRGRQNVASFLAKDLKLDWRWGARFFENQLVDYDCSSNWGNWAYIAGVGNDPRENRYFNTWKQALLYDPDATYIRKWLPQLAHLPKAHFHRPEGMTSRFLISEGFQPIQNYPEPLVFEIHS
jgi:deoxyribodipyrimidine photo-lyase